MLIVAFSGGADSVLAAHRAATTGRPMTFFYLHHYNTPIEPVRLAVFNETRARYPKAPWVQQQADVVSTAKRLGYSWEHTASLMRRKRLLQLRARIPGSDVVTGHNYSDYLETLALRRGRKIPEESLPRLGERDDATGFVRPLFKMTREEIRAEVTALGFSYFDDPANEDMSFARNRVRTTHPVTPSLTKRGGTLPLLFPREGGRGDEFNRELHLPLAEWIALSQAEKSRAVFAAFRRLAIVRKFTRSHFSRAHKLPFSLPPFFAHAENISGAEVVVFRRGLGTSVALPASDNGACMRGDTVTGKFFFRKPFGRKSLVKIFSERRLSPRERRRTLVYPGPTAHEVVRIDYPDGSTES